MSARVTVRGRQVLLPDGFRPATVFVEDGRIARIGGLSESAAGVSSFDAGDCVILPGLVDTHVHFNEPGRTDWEGFESGTRAAAAGGVTTVVDMPLNSIPATTTRAGLDEKVRAAHGRCQVDVGFWGGVVPGNAGELESLAAGGVLGFKCFLSPSGVDEFGHVTEADLRLALPVIARLDLPLLVHAESPAFLTAPADDADPRAYETWLASRGIEAEHAAIELLVRFSREYRARIHVVHLAASGAVPLLRAARRDGVPISVETCPHYLTFAAEDISYGATAFKCAPPIRARTHRERLWQALVDGDLDLIATDHSPAPPAMKHLDDGDFVAAWGGVASLQLGLSAAWTAAAGRDIPLDRVVRAMTLAPARLAGLARTKGAIAPGRDADLVIWNPDAETVVRGRDLDHQHPVTPYEGMRLRGRAIMTMVRGRIVFEEGQFRAPSGRCLFGRYAVHSSVGP